jgi:hypothetical protein
MDFLAQISIIHVAVLAIVLFSLFIFFRQILFFGFTPFLPSRPDVIEKILSELAIKKGMAVYSLESGRTGFLGITEKKHPGLKLVGVKNESFGCLMAKLQAFLKGSKIKVKKVDFYKIDIRDANIVFCYLDTKDLREMYKKLKIEPRSGAIIVSLGFVIPYLEPLKIVKTEEKKRWYNFFIGRHEKIITEKEKEFKRDNKIYFYEV